MAPAGTLFGSRRLGASTAATRAELRETRDEIAASTAHLINDAKTDVMDFWSRLIGGSPAASQKPPVDTPQQRLARFKKAYNQLLQTWRISHEDPFAEDAMRVYVQQLTEILIEEEKRPGRVCLQFAYDQQVFVTIAKIGQSAANEGLIKEAIAAFSTLADYEEGEFLANEMFAQSLINFLRRVGGRGIIELEGEYVELLFSIASKIRLQPEILPVWFTTSPGSAREEVEMDKQQKFAGVTLKDDFPLFYLLIDYVHNDGRVGDFARTGLLYLIESASSSEDLERWIVDSDLATLMASGLGALYSQLSRKLVMSYSEDDPPAILALSDYTADGHAFGVEHSNSPEFKGHMETFLSYLIFWQDVLEHCKSVEVKQTLLDHFQVLFLQQLLYPSLLESSDIDGGSSVAVITYLCRILESIEHPDLIHLILHYLLAIPEEAKPVSEPKSSGAARRRKSLDLLSQFAAVDDKPTPELFNLVDLILTSLKSKNHQTVSATLKLVSVVLRRHHPYAVSTLLRISPVMPSTPQRTIGAHNKEIESLLRMVSEIGGEENFDESYDAYLKDNLTLCECHPCSAAMLTVKNGAPRHTPQASTLLGKPRELYPHTLRLDDPLLRTVTNLLGSFFSNSVELNLSLTAAVIDLASCHWMKPEFWLLVDPSKYVFDDSEFDELDDAASDFDAELAEIMGVEEDPLDTLEKEQMRAFKLASREPRWTAVAPILEVLKLLLGQIAVYRHDNPDLDERLAERKQEFQVSDELGDAIMETPIPPRNIPRKQSAVDALSQRILGTSPRSSGYSTSPRGRQMPGAYDFATPSRPPAKSSRSFMSPSPNNRALPPLPSPSPSKGLTSPLSNPFTTPDSRSVSRRIRAPEPIRFPLLRKESRDERRGSDTPEIKERKEVEERESASHGSFTLGHLLTNIVVLQEFILELAALVQVRASLYGDVKFV